MIYLTHGIQRNKGVILMGKKTLYLECYSGISGDMTVASLIDLGVDHEYLLNALRSLNINGYNIEISRVLKAGIDACDFNVILDAAHENHDHDMEYLHGHPHHDHDHHHEHDHHHDHDHWHDHLILAQRKYFVYNKRKNKEVLL